MKKSKKHLLIGCGVIITLFSYQQLQKWHTEITAGFSPSKIMSELTFNPNWVMPPLSLEEQRHLASALSQNYAYLGTGGQCFAFMSDDGEYVVKFFKHNRRNTPFYAKLPMPRMLKKKMEEKVRVRKAKLERDFTSYKISIEELKDDTGMIFAHLNKTKDLRKSLSIKDKAGRLFTIDLDNTEFIVQKKANLIYPQIQNFMGSGQPEKAQRLINSLLSLIIHRSEKGIFDEDARIYRNFGCIGEQAIVIDTGRFRKMASIQDPRNYIQDIHAITDSFKDWLGINYPELKSYLEEQIYALEARYY